MPPDGFFVLATLAIVFLGFPAVVISGIRKLKEAKWQALGQGEGMGASELRRLIRDAVEEANAPLLERVEALEARAVATRLLEAAPPRPGEPAALSETEREALAQHGLDDLSDWEAASARTRTRA